jgi:hypothetical protein
MGRYALLIGISNYKAGLDLLPSAVKDVDALWQVLLNPEIGGFAESDVVVLKDAEKGAIETAIYIICLPIGSLMTCCYFISLGMV